MNQDRIERYSNIDAYLDFPYAQKPSPDQRLRQMLTVEQTMNLRLTNSRQPWNLITKTITTVAGIDTYVIDQPVSANQNSGKAYFVVRSTGNLELPNLPVPFDDFSELDYGKLPGQGWVNQTLSVSEKISFYRANMQNATINAVIQPAPQEALTYIIWFFAGSLDRSQALMTGTAGITELSDYLDLKTAASLIGRSEWRDDDIFNDQKRKTLAAGIGMQLNDLEPIVEDYIGNINHPKSFEMSHSFEH